MTVLGDPENSLAKNPNVMFVHFRKVAGTSIVNALQKSSLHFPTFHRNGQQWTGPRGDEDAMLVRTSDFGDKEWKNWMAENHQLGVDCVVCEWGLPKNMDAISKDAEFEIFTCMRDPYSRFTSEFYFHDNFHVPSPVDGFGQEDRAGMMASDWLEQDLFWKRDKGTPFPVSINKPNFYTRLLCGLAQEPYAELTKKHLEYAKEMLRRFTGIIILGIPESYNLLRRWNFQDRLPRSRVKAGRRDETFLDISREEFNLINALDVELFEFAMKLTEARLQVEVMLHKNLDIGRDSVHDAIMAQTDIIVPMKRRGVITRCVLEALSKFYRPRRIVVVTCLEDCNYLQETVTKENWNVGRIEYINEDELFLPIGITRQDIETHYHGQTTVEGDRGIRLKMREFGWWFQQIIKLGAGLLIPGISDTYVVWDSDLVPLRRWPLCKLGPNGKPIFNTAILQQTSRAGNAKEYIRCLKDMLRLPVEKPIGGGTFVTHHMCFEKHLCTELLNTIVRNATEMGYTTETNWPLAIMDLTQYYCRFSEYLMYASFAKQHSEHGFGYHSFDQYGRGGVRMRQGETFVHDLIDSYGGLESMDSLPALTYDQIIAFAKTYYKGDTVLPPYLQLDHMYVDLEVENTPKQWRYSVAYTFQKSGPELKEAQEKLVQRKSEWWQRFHDKGCIFIHIPKNAGTSVESIFGIDQSQPSSQHFTAAELRNDRFHEYEKLFKFCLVRNPYERLLSSYRYLISGGNQKAGDLAWQAKLQSIGSFNDFIKTYFAQEPTWTSYQFPHHMIPQFLFVNDPEENSLLIDAWIDVTDFSLQGLGPLLIRGLPPSLVKEQIPHLRKSPQTTIQYSEETAELVYKAYEMDFVTFGYPKDSWINYA